MRKEGMQLRNPALKYAFSLAMVIAAILVRYALMPLFGASYHYITLYPAIIIVAIFAGRNPAVFTSILGSVAAEYFFSPGVVPADMPAIGIIVLTGLLAGLLAERLHNALAQSRQHSAALAESEQRWRAVFEGIADEVWICDSQGKMSEINLAAKTHMELTEFKEKTLDEVLEEIVILNPDGKPRPAQDAPLLKALKGETVRGEEIMIYRATGKQRNRQYSSAPIRDISGKIVGAVAIVHDITDLRKTQEALSASEQRMRERSILDEAIMANMGEGLFTLDINGLVTYVNPAAEMLLGFTSVELIGRKIHDIVHFKHPDGTAFAAEECPGLQVLERKNTIINQEDMFIRKSGEFFPVVYSSAPIVLDGRVAGLVAVFRDVTERKRIEEEIVRHRDHLTELVTQRTESLEQTVSRLHQREQLLALFIEHAPASIAMMDTQMRYIAVSRRWKDDYGLGDQDLIGHSHYEIFPEIPDRWKEIHRRCLAGAVERAREDFFDRLDGKRQWLQWEVRPWYSDENTIGGIVVFSEDITLRKTAEDELVKLNEQLEQRIEERTRDLRESEEKFRLLAENAQAIIGIVQGQRIVYANPYSEIATGYSIEELLNLDFPKLVHPDYRQTMLERAARRQAGEAVESHYEFILITKTGQEKWLDFSPIMITYRGKPAIVGIAYDITDRKKAEAELRESEEKFRMLAENAAAVIGIMQGERIIYANPYSQRASGYSLDELLNIDIPKLIHPDYQQEMMERAKRREAGEPVESHYEFAMITKQGEKKWLDFSPIRITYRGKPAIIGIAFDITDRKLAEAALRESEEKFRMLAENARAIIGIVQGEKFIYLNPYLEEISGYTSEELLKMPILQIVHPDSRALVLERAKKRQAGEEIESHYEFAIQTKSGQKRLLDFSATRILYQGRPAVVGIAVDITERKRVETDLVYIKEQLENKNKELETIIGIVSHDLRAPLVNVRGFTGEIGKDISLMQEILQQEPVGENILKRMAPVFENFTQSVHFISSSAEAMDNLAASLVSVARAGLAQVNPQQIDMNELIQKVMAGIKFKLTQNKVSYEVAADLPRCFGDKTQITQIFTNLLDNAVKYLDPNRPGQICVGCDIQVGHGLYWVSDNGIGMAPEDQEKIFDPYYQLHEKTAEGVGMGLATVKRMVDRNNGKIWVDSEKGRGATFYIALPLTS